MADIYKTKEIETNINERGVNLGNVDVTLYTMDKGSAAFKVYLKREVNYGNEKVYDSVNLYTTDMTPRIDIVAADGSVFANEPIDIVIPENGVIQYIVSDYVIRHSGKMDVYIYLENKSESVQVANFYFYIEEDGVARRLGKEITGGRLEDVVKNVMSGQLMELLSEDFREQLEREIKTFLQDHNKDFNLRFEDLTREEKDELMKNLTNQGLADFRIEDNSILNEKLVDGTIQPEKTTFFDFNYSNNLLNTNEIQNKTTMDTDGSVIEDNLRWLSDFIPLNASKNEQLNFTQGSYRIALYDKDKNFISRTGVVDDNKFTVDVTSPTKYVRLSGANDFSSIMVNKGEKLLPYESFNTRPIQLKPEYYNSEVEDSSITTSKLKDNSVTSDKLEDNSVTTSKLENNSITSDKLEKDSVTPEKTTFFTNSSTNNLLNLTTLTKDKSFDSKGNIIDAPGYWITDYIPLDSTLGEQINITNDEKTSYRVVLYDENKEVVLRTGIVGTTSYIPTNTALVKKYIRISGSRDVNTVMINKGPELLPYEEPSKLSGYKLKDELYEKFELKENSITTANIKDSAITTAKIKDSAVTTNSIEDKAVTTDKVNFINKQESYNLLDLSTVQMNKTFNSKGNISDDQTRWLTDFIEVDGSKNEQINISKDAYRVAEYDENKEFIQRDDILSENKIIPTESTRYIRVSASRDVNTVMINRGDSLLPLEKNTGNTSEFSPNVKVTPENEVHFKKSNNIFNKNDVRVGKTLDSSGNIVEDADYVLTNPIKITGARVAMSTDNAVRWAVYDKDDKLLSRSGKIAGSDNVLELSRMTTADYFMLSVHKSVYEEFMANYGNKVLSYEEFGYKLVSTKQYPITISSDIVPKTTAGNTEATTQVINGNVIDLQNTKQIYKDISTSYDASTSDEIYNTTSKAQIDYIELSTNNANTELELIYIDDESNEVTVTVTNPSDGEKLPLTLENIVSYGYPNTEFIIYDPKRKTFKIAIKDMRFSDGFKLVAKNNNETSINIGIKLVGRYYV